ncbi:MAG: molybdopterin oxidoreductase family protein [Gammaproteobacteria bacterium]|nr:molybdopterin oxidoreductase family protein [Gammaproteobacteria bacterium]
MTANITTRHYRACHLCEALCGVEILIENDRVVTVRGDRHDPFSHGHICPKAVALKDLHEDPDRLRRPMRKVDGQWQECEWQEAYQVVATKLAQIATKHGHDAVAVYLGNPNVHNWGMMTHGPNFYGLLKTRNRYSATSVDQLPHQMVCYLMYGHQFMVPVPDVDRTTYLLVIGGNPIASNGSLMTVPDFRGRLKALHKRGGKLVVVDPRRTETAEVADRHLFIRPGTDAWFLFALLNVILEEGLGHSTSCQGFLKGWEQAVDALRPFTVELAERISGVPATAIREVAHELAAAKGGVCYGRMGVSVQRFGGLCQWAIQLINIATGNLDRSGGSMFNLPALDLVAGPNNRPGHFNQWQSRVRGLPEFSGELPVAGLAEEILTPGEGQVRALITGAGNPVLSTPNGQQLDRALAGLEFMVSVDFYLNETTRHADVILPPTSPLEHDHYDMALSVFAVRNIARYNAPAFDKPKGAMHDWEIMSALGEHLAAALAVPARPVYPPTTILDMGLKAGPYGQAQGQVPGLDFASLARQPHGIDLGPLKPCLPGRLVHTDKHIDCAPSSLLADIPRLLQAQEDTLNKGLLLIGRRHVRSNNSWMHNFRRLTKGKPRHQLMMNPGDAARLALKNGQRVKVRSRVGEVSVELDVSDAVMPGVVSLPHGWGHGRAGTRMRVADRTPGVCVNDLTDDQDVDKLSGNAVLNGVPVTVIGLSD